jgi:AcrR family transcriptional regulator
MRERKAELLEHLTAYFLEHGLPNISLRPMAVQVGTSARLLVFHFRSKDQLVAEVFEHIHAVLHKSLADSLSESKRQARVAPIRAYWDWATNRKNLPFWRLLYELQMLATRNPVKYGKLLKRNSAQWRDLIDSSLGDSQASWSSLFAAVFDGLFLELLATGDHKRTTAALDTFVTVVAAHRVPSSKSGAKRKST